MGGIGWPRSGNGWSLLGRGESVIGHTVFTSAGLSPARENRGHRPTNLAGSVQLFADTLLSLFKAGLPASYKFATLSRWKRLSRGFRHRSVDTHQAYRHPVFRLRRFFRVADAYGEYMLQDAQGLIVTTSSREVVLAYDSVVDGYVRCRIDTGRRLSRLLDTGPDFGMAHVLKGYLAMLTYSRDYMPRAQEALAAARLNTVRATARERAHVEALAQWIEGYVDRALAIWEETLIGHPRDLLALRLHHINALWLGQRGRLLTTAEYVAPHWVPELPGYTTMLACRAFASEECGQYVVAEELGRAAIAIDPGDLYAAHAVAHVMEMQGRRTEGIAFLNGLESHWEAGNNMKHHLWWHCALFLLELNDFDAVLDLYDRRFRDPASPLVTAMPDLYADVQNAASTLFRLELRGVPVGERWSELADKAEARIGDCLSAFTLPHWMMALTWAERWNPAMRLLESIREAGKSGASGSLGAVLSQAVAPICEAVILHRQGNHTAAVTAMRPALGLMHQLGGSHAQAEVLEQLFLDAAMKAGLVADARTLLERVAMRYPVPPQRRIGYMDAARHCQFSDGDRERV